jgi:hypothetical protein
VKSPILIVCLAGLALACSEDRGQGEVLGSLYVADCVDGRALDAVCAPDSDPDTCDAFDLGVDFFALETFDDIGRIRMQRGGRPFARTNGLLFEIRDVRLLRGALGQPVAVGPDENLRASLGLFERCPDSTQNFDLTGVVVFDDFGVAKGETVAGQILRLEVRDGRGAPPGPVLGVLHGEFDFRLRRGPPYQQFSR